MSWTMASILTGPVSYYIFMEGREVRKGSHFKLFTQCLFQLLGQAARNMVIQEDAILHSEDVSSTGIQVHTTVAQVTGTVFTLI